MGTVIPFLKPAANRAGFSSQDRKELLQWQVGRARLRRLRCFYQEPGTLGDQQDLDFAQVYRPAAQWASWGLARVCTGVLVWECARGTDLGVFASLAEALACVELHAGEPIELALPDAGTTGCDIAGLRCHHLGGAGERSSGSERSHAEAEHGDAAPQAVRRPVTHHHPRVS